MKKFILIALVFAGFAANAQFGIKPIVQEPLCNGANTGSISLVITGGTPPYSYQWCCGLGTSNSITGLTAGFYNVTVTDNTGATVTYPGGIGLAQPTAITLEGAPSNVSVHGGSDGCVHLTTFGGTPNYTFNWSNGSTQESQCGLAAGFYQVTVTDAFGCQAVYGETVTQPSHPIINPGLLSGNIGGISQGFIHQQGSPEHNTGGNGSDRSDFFGSTGNSAPEMNSNEISVYPNPTADYISVRTGSNNAEITLSNSLGQTISHKMADANETKFDVTSLGKGDYIVSVKTATGTVNKMVSVIR